MTQEWEYGSLGTFGIAVPQANPVVEPEMQALMPDGVNLITNRLRGSRTNSCDRLVGYFQNLAGTLAGFDTAEITVAGYACTGSAYILGRSAEDDGLAQLSRRFGYPVISSSQAIAEALRHLGVGNIALIAPYPQWLSELSVSFWQQDGFAVVDHLSAPIDPNDTRSAYRFRSSDIAPLAEKLEREKADVLLLSGTGMPTLRALNGLTEAFGLPVLSSNLCLAWAAMRRMGRAEPLPVPLGSASLTGNWRQRLRA